MRNAAEVPDHTVVLQFPPESVAGVLTAVVGVQDRAANQEASGIDLEHVDAQGKI